MYNDTDTQCRLYDVSVRIAFLIYKIEEECSTL